MTYDIYVQMVEIYNEHVRDLLTEDKIDNKLEIRSCNDDGLSLPYTTLCSVGDIYVDVLTLMKLNSVRSTVLKDVTERERMTMVMKNEKDGDTL
ncbi:hypothetical protein Ahy_A06g027581 [Arachis hypogaea]|uniref:Kinesin motor domain-containing protein n=1 Tax=Arachis hypogaea TaxID=3818 RepID=A0A445CP49_ARAHY|nr:hypothetical protein Ahy_A06g027581 [Arachis hypogaea]